MLPNNTLSPKAVFAPWAYPVKGPGPQDLLKDFELGGKDLSDASLGLELKVWTGIGQKNEAGTYDIILSAPGSVSTTVLTVAALTELSIAFDQNMHPFITYVDGGVAKYYWFDPVAGSFQIVNIGAGVTTPRCTLDDHRSFNVSGSDVILMYVRAGNLYYRQERDRFGVEILLHAVGAGAQLVCVGMTNALRLQWRIHNYTAALDDQVSQIFDPFLGDIVKDICLRAGIPAEAIDVSQLYTVNVPGYKIAITDDSTTVMTPLSNAFFFDPGEWDKQIHFIMRGGQASGSFTFDDLVNQSGQVPMKQTRADETKLPLRVNVTYLDPASGYATNQQSVTRKSNQVVTTQNKDVDLSVVLNADQAMQTADITIKSAWHEQMTYDWALPIGFTTAVPTDVLEYTAQDGSIQRIRVTSRNEDGNIIKFEGTQDSSGAYDSSAVGVTTPPPLSTTPGLIGETRLELLNIPVLRDQDDELGIYVAMSGDSSAWFGAQLLVSTDGGVNYFEALRSQQPVSVGDSTTELLPEHSAEYPSNQVLIVTCNFELSSIDDDTLLNNGNRAVIGDEIIQFRDVLYLGSNTYRLSHLIRGRYNTTPDHWPIGTRFVLLDSTISFLQAQQWMIGKDLMFKPVSLGTTEDETVPTSYEFDTAANQTEWPPHGLQATRDGSDNVGVTWIPRPRLGVETSPYNSKYFAGFVVQFSDGFSATVPTNATSYTRAATPAGVTITVCGINAITGNGPNSEGVTI